MRRIITKEETQKIIADYNNGVGSDSIAKELNLSPTAILRVLKRNNIDRRPIKKKTDQDEILKICQEYKDGYSTYDLGKKYRLSFATINNYLKENNVDRRDMSECHRIYDINEDFFDEINCEEKAYLLGLLASDGCNQKEANAVRISLHPQDKDILYKFSKLIYKKDSDSHVKFYTKFDKLKNKSFDSASLTIFSKYMCNSLKNNGIPPNKTFILKYPTYLSNNLNRHFIRGEFDGDGSITVDGGKKKNSCWKITGTLDLCEKIKEIILKELNITCSITKCNNSEVWNVYSGGKRNVEQICDWIYKDATIWLDRKYNSYLFLKERIQEINSTFKVGGFHHNKYVLKK
jgi:intein-encoded DNA endonuclease-like protein